MKHLSLKSTLFGAAAVTCALAGSGWTQGPPAAAGQCGTPQPSPALIAQIDRDLEQQRRVAARGSGTVYVNVHFHVIHQTANYGNYGDLTDSQIQAQIDVLNSAFSGQDGPAGGQAPSAQATANTPFRFVLASVDRTPNMDWFFAGMGSAAEAQMKSALRVGGPADLNVYTNNPGGGLSGWSTFPWDYIRAPQMDGVVVLFATLPGGSLPGHTMGDTLVHEAGHWLGLLHTFQGGCSKTNDSVSDTPAEKSGFSGAPPPYPDSCTGKQYPGRDPVENFMDYADDPYKFQFTAGQSSRMDSMSLQYRGL